MYFPSKLTISKLLQLIETFGDSYLTKQRWLLNKVDFSFPFEKQGDLIQLEMKGVTLLTSSRPLSAVYNGKTDDAEIPVMDPISETITLVPENMYELRNLYPLKSGYSKSHPHTIFLHYNKSDVKNIYEEEVTEEQILGRNMVAAFAAAGAYARQLYGVSDTFVYNNFCLDNILKRCSINGF